MTNRGQAALEFLMTYGWAILAAIIAIGVLAYFGVFSPGKYMPNACIINNPFGCDDYKVNTTGVFLVVRNGGGDVMNVSAISVSGCTTATPSNTSMADGDTVTYGFTGCSGLTPGGKFKGDISITYNTATGTFLKTSTGTITSKIE